MFLEVTLGYQGLLGDIHYKRGLPDTSVAYDEQEASLVLQKRFWRQWEVS